MVTMTTQLTHNSVNCSRLHYIIIRAFTHLFKAHSLTETMGICSRLIILKKNRIDFLMYFILYTSLKDSSTKICCFSAVLSFNFLCIS